MTEPITVGILSYKRPHALRACVQSLHECTSIPFRLHLVNQGYLDKELEHLYADLSRQSHIKITYLKENIGCAGGRKLLSEALETPYIFYSDDDITFTQGWLEPLLAIIESRNEAGALSPCLIHVHANAKQEVGGTLHRTHQTLHKRWYSPQEAARLADADHLVPSDFLLGGCVLIRREIFRLVRHDPNYFMDWEDLDFWLQTLQTPWKRYVCLRSHLYHKPPDTQGSIKRTLAYHSVRSARQSLEQSRAHFLKKWNLTSVEHHFYLPDRYAWVYRIGRPVKHLAQRSLKQIFPWIAWG